MPKDVRVSTLLGDHGLSVNSSWFTEESRERGQLVHWLGEHVLKGIEVSCAPSMSGYLEALRKGAEVLSWSSLLSECRMTSGFVTGRPDSLGLVRKRAGSIPAGPAILDIKSGEPYDSHGVQLALYELLARETGKIEQVFGAASVPVSRIGLYVKSDGKYHVKLYDDSTDRIAAAALVNITRWRAAHGMLPDQPPIEDPQQDEELL